MIPGFEGVRTHSLSAGCPAACLLAAATAPCTPLESREEGARPLVRPCCLASLGRWRPRWNAVLRPLSALLCHICESDSLCTAVVPALLGTCATGHGTRQNDRTRASLLCARARIAPLLLRAAHARAPALQRGAVCSTPLGELLPHFSAPARQRAQRVRVSNRAARFCALALAYARRDASAPLPVGKNSENLPRPTLEEELFCSLQAASVCSASLACCLTLRLACPDANRLSESCPCLAHLS